ncbi:MAG: hypothetical protein ACYC9O_15410 [Candidatus Latescibacterota bacterium]
MNEIRIMKRNLFNFFKPKSFYDFIVIIVAIIGLIVTIRFNNKIENTTFDVNSMQYKPIIDIQEQPAIISYKPQFVKDFLKFENRGAFVGVTIDSLRIMVKLINKGNSTAKLVAVVLSDTVSGDSYIRELLINKKARAKRVRITLTNSFYMAKEIRPNQVYEEEQVFERIKKPTDNQICLHILLLYINEIGTLYDTYYWSRYNIKEIFEEKDLFPYNFVTKMEANINGKLIKSPYYVIDKADNNTSNHTYSKNESKDILDFLKGK